MLLFHNVHYKISRIVFEWNVNLVQSVFVVGTRMACPNSSNKQTKNTFSFQLHTSLILACSCWRANTPQRVSIPFPNAARGFLKCYWMILGLMRSCDFWCLLILIRLLITPVDGGATLCLISVPFLLTLLWSCLKKTTTMMRLKQSTVEFLLSCYFVFLTWWHPPVSSPHPFFRLLLASLGLACVTARVSLCSTSFHLQSDCL